MEIIRAKSSRSVESTVQAAIFEQSTMGVGSGFQSFLFEISDTVYDAISRIAWAFSGMEFVLKNKDNGEILRGPKSHPLLDLLDSPSMDQNNTMLKYELMVDFLMYGNCFPIAVGNVNYEPIELKGEKAGKAVLLQNGKDELSEIYFAKSDSDTYYRQIIPKRKMIVFQQRNQLAETFQLMINKRKSGVEAESPLRRIYYQASTKYFGNIHNSSIMKNGTRPGGLWSPAKDGMSQANYEAFQKEVQSKFSGPSNAGRNIVAPVAMNYENFLVNTRDMEFSSLIENSRVEIYGIYKIPLPLVVTKTMTMSNYKTSLEAFYDLAVLPPAKHILQRLGEFLLPRYKDNNYVLSYDEKDMPALKQRMFERAETMRKVGSFSENEIRTQTGYESTADGNAIYKSTNLVQAGEDDYTDDNIE